MDNKDHSILRNQDVRFEAGTEPKVPIPPTVSMKTPSRETIATRLGSLLILLVAVIAGSVVWWSSFSYEEPEPINVEQLVAQLKVRRSAMEMTTATTTIDNATSTASTTASTTTSDENITETATSSKPQDSTLRIFTPEGGETLCLGQEYTIRWEGPEDLSTVSLYVGGRVGYGLGPFFATRNESDIPGTGEYVWKVGFSQDGKDKILPAGEVYTVSITGHFPLSNDKGDILFELSKPIFIEDCRG